MLGRKRSQLAPTTTWWRRPHRPNEPLADKSMDVFLKCSFWSLAVSNNPLPVKGSIAPEK
ncbi:hypothetical protein D3C71_1865860 [compost metagenome]